MKAQLKCSNCGAEITNVSMSWGRRYWLFVIPLLAFMIFYPTVMTKIMEGETHDFRADLIATYEAKRYNDGFVEVIGTIENTGTVDWSHLTVEAKLFDDNGEFLDQLLDYISITIPTGGKETVIIGKNKFPEQRWTRTSKVIVRVTDASYDRF